MCQCMFHIKSGSACCNCLEKLLSCKLSCHSEKSINSTEHQGSLVNSSTVWGVIGLLQSAASLLTYLIPCGWEHNLLLSVFVYDKVCKDNIYLQLSVVFLLRHMLVLLLLSGFHSSSLHL